MGAVEMTLLLPYEAKTLELRPYQETTIEQLREALRRGHKRIILCAPTGSGKTEMAIHLIREAREKGSRVAFVADRITLVDQTSARLYDYGIPHGIAQSSNTRARYERIQVCSAQTIEKRAYWNSLDLLIIDEAHVQRKAILKFAKDWGGPVIGLTATPLTPGLNETYTHLVNATTTDALLAEGWLASLRIYAATPMDMRGAKVVAGEWTAEEVRARGSRIIGDIVSDYVRLTHQHFGGAVKTLVFSADIAHGQDLCRAFQLAGYDFRQSTYKDSDDETQRLVEGFRRGNFTGLVSVEKFVKGFDVPDVLCMIGARPYRSSLASVVQQLGRGMRTADGKEFCLYLDHAENMAGWYEDVCEIWEKGVEKLPDPNKEKKTRKEGPERQDVVCNCGMVMPPGATSCPYCGGSRRGRRSQSEVVAGRMEEWTRPGSREWAKDKEWTWQQICRIAIERKPGDIESAYRFAWKQYQVMMGGPPPKAWDFTPVDAMADRRVERKIWQQLRAWANGKMT